MTTESRKPLSNGVFVYGYFATISLVTAVLMVWVGRNLSAIVGGLLGGLLVWRVVWEIKNPPPDIIEMLTDELMEREAEHPNSLWREEWERKKTEGLSSSDSSDFLKKYVEGSRPYSAEDFPCPVVRPGYGYRYDSKEPVQFAVIGCWDEPEDLKSVGARIKEWCDSHPCVTEVFGLEQMLNGELPCTPSHHFGLPYSFTFNAGESISAFRPEPLTLLLIMVEGLSSTPQLGDDLLAYLDGYPCNVQSPAYFEYISE